MIKEQDDRFLGCQQKLYRFALSLTKNKSDAKDIHQETLIKIWQLRNEWDRWSNFEAYAMKIVRNNFLNFKKKSNLRHFVALDDLKEEGINNETEQKISLDDLKLKFMFLIKGLPDLQRSILYLREIEEMEYKEIGEVLDISESQVKVYLFRGRVYLKTKVKGK